MVNDAAIDIVTGAPLPTKPIRLVDYDPHPTEWMWQWWLPRGYITLLASRGGMGKGSIALEMCLASVGALDAFPDGTPAPPVGEHSAILLGYEDDPDSVLAKRMAAFGTRRSGGAPNILVHPDLRTRTAFEAIDDLLQWNPGPHVGLIVVDPLANVIGREGKTENDNAEMTELMERFASIAEAQQAAVLLVHHDRKRGPLDVSPMQDGARGASAIANSVRCYWGLTEDPQGDTDVRLLGKTKSNLSGLRGVIEYRMTPWTDRDDSRINTGILQAVGHDDDVTLEQAIKERKQKQRENIADVLSAEILEYLRRDDTKLPILQHDLRIVFPDPERKPFGVAISILKKDGLIGHHVMTKTEAKELGFQWRPHQYVISLLGAQHD